MKFHKTRTKAKNSRKNQSIITKFQKIKILKIKEVKTRKKGKIMRFCEEKQIRKSDKLIFKNS